MHASTPDPGPAGVDLRIAPDSETMSQAAAAEIGARIRAAVAERGVAHVALSGGTTPVGAYELLAASLADWDGIQLYFADERCVGPQDEQSNYRLAKEAFLAGADAAEVSRPHVPDEQLHRAEGELGPAVAADRYAQLLRAQLPLDSAGMPVLDLAVLGIGPDGHIASLFPGHAALEADPAAVCLGIDDSPKPPPQRVTMSLSVLRAARCCVLMASGAAKAQALSGALDQPSAQAPASLLERDTLVVIADAEAASLLTQGTA